MDVGETCFPLSRTEAAALYARLARMGARVFGSEKEEELFRTNTDEEILALAGE